jgi:hypothetical protein
MKDISKVVETGSFIAAVVICGSVVPEVRMPIKAAMMEGYENLQTVGKELRKLFYNNKSPLYYS